MKKKAKLIKKIDESIERKIKNLQLAKQNTLNILDNIIFVVIVGSARETNVKILILFVFGSFSITMALFSTISEKI